MSPKLLKQIQLKIEINYENQMGWFNTGFMGEKELMAGDDTDDSKNPYNGILMEYLYSRQLPRLQNVDDLKLGHCSVVANMSCLNLLLGLTLFLFSFFFG